MSEAVADLVVLAPDRPEVSLVAEVKLLERAGLGAAEEQLKRYMLGQLCPIGLLVTPRWNTRKTIGTSSR